MSLYKIGTCSYCDDKNKILRPSPFMADTKAMMCEHCWNETKKEYAASNGEYIDDFDSNKSEYEKLKQQDNDTKNKIKKQINDMYGHGYTVEEIAENLSEDCVQDFRECPEWCGENADCYDCWVKCLKIELEN